MFSLVISRVKLAQYFRTIYISARAIRNLIKTRTYILRVGAWEKTN